MKKENVKKLVKYWKDSGLKDFEAAQSLFEKRLYPQCLFFCHLTLEKLLKALVIEKTQKFAPFIHDLKRLAEIAKIDLNKQQQNDLEKIFTFNIAGRYPEEKLEFYKKYNKKEITEKYFTITKGLILWLKKSFLKK